SIMRECVTALKAEDVHAVAFGDLFLEDIRAYREKQLTGNGIEPLFPLWLEPTDKLAQEMIAGGLKAKLVCVDPKKLDPRVAGHEFDALLLEELPPNVDPCGENGEFHTCVYAGAMFRWEIPLISGEVVERDGFVFCDAVLKR